MENHYAQMCKVHFSPLYIPKPPFSAFVSAACVSWLVLFNAFFLDSAKWDWDFDFNELQVQSEETDGESSDW